ncbi:MAG TPA: fused MFS/spermidine synthase [Noviherbaspirillum sp.]|jgi:spermidine synthase|uniref:fused MFS/spermidine synthase n=1 Tax=Noviherbaspirillum sp. TaxID=1926288 RepID=UPI002F943AAB
MTRLLFAGTIFCSAFLLFLVQPLISKQILPWFGGSAAVWASCLAFFQAVLLAGYAYADWVTRHLSARSQALLHLTLLALSLAFLPIVADAGWKPDGTEDPSWRILLMLGATIGLPYFLLSTTGPLVQGWISRTLPGARVYRYYALSNLASLAALIGYPLLLEPRARVPVQAGIWSALYVLFAVLCAASALRARRQAPSLSETHRQEGQLAPQAPRPASYLLWLLLSALGSWLLLAVTNHITQNIASVPFLWVLPLSLYLLSFILCFESDRWYRRAFFLPAGAAALLLCAYGLQDARLGFNIRTAVPLYATGLFLLCMFLHGELAAMRPPPRYLTRFYLMLSLGGALGGIAVGLLVPRLLPSYYELGIGLAAVAVLAVFVFAGRRVLVAASVLLALACGYFLQIQVSRDLDTARRIERNFYGSVRTQDTLRGEGSVRGLYHGSIRHGEQYLVAHRRQEPTSYYGEKSGVALAIREAGAGSGGRRVGVIGLGTGTLAAYGREGDVFRFYEINPQVMAIARDEFSFLRDSRARVETVLGDARLALEKEAPQHFDVLAVDAFSGDAIPVHLITREALSVYRRHLRPGGVVAFHVTNKFLSLAPVVERLAADQGLHAVRIVDSGNDTTGHRTDWVLVSAQADILRRPAIRDAAAAIPAAPGLAVWTDDFNNLFEVLR